MLVLAPFLYSLFFFSYATPVLAVPIPTYSYAGYARRSQRRDIPDTDGEGTSVYHGRRSLVSLVKRINWAEFTKFDKDAPKMFAAVGATALIGGLGYGLLDKKVKHHFGWDKNATTAAGATGVAPAGQSSATSAHSHFGASDAAQSAPTPETTQTNQATVSSSSQSMVFAGEDITTWPDSGTSNQRKRSLDLGDQHLHRLGRRGGLTSFFTDPEFRNEIIHSHLGQELLRDTKKDVLMAAGGGAAMVVGMGAFSHYLGGKKNATTTPLGSPAAGGVSMHSHFSSAGVVAASQPQAAIQTTPSEAVPNEDGSPSSSSSSSSPNAVNDDGKSKARAKEEKEAKKKTEEAKAEKEKEKEAKKKEDEEQSDSSSNSPKSKNAPSEAVLRKRGTEEAKALETLAEDSVNEVKGKLKAGSIWHDKENFWTKKMSNGKSIVHLSKDALLSTIAMVAAGAAVVYAGQYIWGPNSWLSPDSFRKRKRSLDGIDGPTVNSISARLTNTDVPSSSSSSSVSKRSLSDLVRRDLGHEMQDLTGHTLHHLRKRGLQGILLTALGLGGAIGGTMLFSKLDPDKKPKGPAGAGGDPATPDTPSAHSHFAASGGNTAIPTVGDMSTSVSETSTGPKLYKGEDLTAVVSN
ncbi:hypothetical protein FRB96_008735 [Tulasnella sp. 330]|nr:hypothetical protein FRB96_008735 [Tulasnella sp. 330]